MGSEDEVADIARWYTHTGILSASNLVLSASTTTPLSGIKKESRVSVTALRSAGGRNIPDSLVTVADAFQTLQEARHSADYDANYDPVRATTINHVIDAQAALKSAQSLWRARDSPKSARRSAHAAYLTFLRLTLLKSGGPRVR